MSEEHNTQNEDLQRETVELKDEQFKTRRMQIYAVIFMTVVIAIFLGFRALSGFINGFSSDETEKKTIATNVQKGDLQYSNNKQDIKELPKLPESSDTTSMRDFINENTGANENSSPFAPAAARSQIKPKVYKNSGAILVSTSSEPSFEANQSESEPDPLSSGEYTLDAKGKLVKKTEFDITEEGYSEGTFEAKAAKKSKFDPNLLLLKGTYIGCSLDTRLVSSIQGGVACTVSEDVYSANGVTLLIEKGSHITGYFNSGQMNDGLNRIFVVWQEIRTPNGVIIPVYSGASDSLGGSGIEGYVDHHWLERFGAAILLSVIDDAVNVGLNGGSGTRSNENRDYTENTREATQQMANTALEKFINIEPTLYKNQGDLVGVYVNRDIDFSKVYQLRVRKNGRKRAIR